MLVPANGAPAFQCGTVASSHGAPRLSAVGKASGSEMVVMATPAGLRWVGDAREVLIACCSAGFKGRGLVGNEMEPKKSRGRGLEFLRDRTAPAGVHPPRRSLRTA